MSEPLAAIVEGHLRALVADHPDRQVGRPGNTAANDYVERVLLDDGWRVSSTDFEALDCDTGPAQLLVDGRDLPIHPGPYSVAADVSGPLAVIESLDTLSSARIENAVVLLRGEIAADQLFPKSFTFLDVPEHRRIYELLEAGRPAAVLSATGRGSGLAGSLYPYPLIEDGDFDIPNAYMTDESGAQLAGLEGNTARVTIEARRFRVTARQIIAERGPSSVPRAIIMAHIDSKGGSPGAVDNATGVAALLGSARLLNDYDGPYRIELLPMNGEDYYANCGEHLFEAANEGRWDEIVGAINMDAIGARNAGTAISMYGVSDEGSEVVHRVLRRHPSISIGEQWFESDHSIVAMHDRPAIALTSTSFRELCETVTHTERDTLDIVDPTEVAAASEFVADLIRALPAVGSPEA